MNILYPCCAGLDIHKETVVVCVRRHQGQGRAHQETRTFGTATSQLIDLADWLSSQGVTHLAMESTGVYWKPVWNILEGQFEMLLANARVIKQVPGRKTEGERQGCGMDRATVSAWPIAKQLYSWRTAKAVA